MPSHEEITARLRAKYPSAIVDVPVGTKDPTLLIDAGQIHDVALFLRDEIGLDYLSDLTAVDWPDRFEVVYHLFGTRDNVALFTLKVPLADKADPAVASVVDVWKSADFQEREVFDLMGIRFDGHPNLKRIMMWDGYEGHPLRKDFVNRTYTFAELEPSRAASCDW
jgi:NADH-quinone oxidoreductase subunit C